jgi:hypothetical protein
MTDYVKPGAGALDGCPADAREFLLEHGLPRRVGTIFAAATRSARTSRYFGGREIDGIVLGFSAEHCELALDYEQSKVWLLAPWKPDAPILVNSSVQKFAECLGLAADAEADIESLRTALTTIDSATTEDPDSFWPAVLESMAMGDYP